MSDEIYAFPAANAHAVLQEGMSLRDWFAGMELSKHVATSTCDTQSAYDRLADHCYRMADAMLRAREAK